jgi:hypothetical protein
MIMTVCDDHMHVMVQRLVVLLSGFGSGHLLFGTIFSVTREERGSSKIAPEEESYQTRP